MLALGEQRPVLGLHLRGTDKMSRIGGRIMGPERYRPLIQHYMQKRPDAVLLLASDSPTFVAEMQREYGQRLVVYDALRSERNAFADKRLSDNFRKGVDALVDALALSCSNFLIKPASALSEFAVYWNYPGLHNHTYEIQYEAGLPDPIAALDAHLASPRDALRGWNRCAEVMREEPR